MKKSTQTAATNSQRGRMVHGIPIAFIPQIMRHGNGARPIRHLRAIQVDLFANLQKIYSLQMDPDVAGTLAAQVVNFLKGADIDEIARVSEEPLRSRIAAILPQVPHRAAECMEVDRQTREIIFATLRMTTVLNFGSYGEAWLQNPEKMRIERLLVEYGPEFTEEITPEAYAKLVAAYHAVKRTAWAGS